MPCDCPSLVWRPAVANTFTGFTAAPQTTHVGAISGLPTFTITGPVRGVRFRSPDLGGPSQPAGDGAIDFTMTTAQTGLITQNAGWTPVLPVFPAIAVPGPFVKTQSGITITLNSDGHRAQDGLGGNGYRLAKQNSNPISPEHEWITFEFSSLVTNVAFGGNFFQGGGIAPLNEGISQLQVLTDGPCDCCPLYLYRCYNQEELQVLFSSAAITANPAGYAVSGAISQLIDQSLAGSPICGFGTPAVQITPQNSPVIEFSFASPQNRISRVQEHNQGGGDLNDSDGFGVTSFSLLSPTGAILYTGTLICGNGAAPFSTSFPPVDNVAKIRWWNLTKVNPTAGVAPLAREFQAFQSPVRIAEAMRCAGVITWFDTITGDVVDPVNFVSCF